MLGSSETTRSARSSFRENIVQVKKCSLIFNSLISVTTQPSLVYKTITRSYSSLSNKQNNKVGNQDNLLNIKAVDVSNSLKQDRLKILQVPSVKADHYCAHRGNGSLGM